MECEQYTDEKHKEWAEKFSRIPMTELPYSLRVMIGHSLNTPMELFNSEGVLQNWIGLAECMGFNSQRIGQLESSKNPTIDLLAMYEQIPQNTIKDFVLLLLEMERYDLLELPEARCQFEKVIRKYKQRDPRMDTAMSPVQVATVDSSYRPPRSLPHPEGHSLTSYKPRTDHHVDETKYLTTWEGYYDAFISYSKGDWWFIEHLMSALEVDPYNQRLCIADRDFLPGSAEMSAIATLVTKRCRRVIVVLSPNFVECPMCDFTVKYTASLSPGARSKKMIPVMIQDCELLPPVITFITMLHYTKDDANRWFWERLAMSLSVPLDPKEVEISDKSMFMDTCLLNCEELSGKKDEEKKVLPIEESKEKSKKDGPPPGSKQSFIKERLYPSTDKEKCQPMHESPSSKHHKNTKKKTVGADYSTGCVGSSAVVSTSNPPSDEEMLEEPTTDSSRETSPSSSMQSLTEEAVEATEYQPEHQPEPPSSILKRIIRLKRKKKDKVPCEC